MRVLAFDIGLRNLAASVISFNEGWSFPKEYISEEETADEFKERAMGHFLKHGWRLEQWDVIDVSESLGRVVKNVKKLGDVTKAVTLSDTLESLEEKWFPDSAPDVVCVENQHNANAVMRGVCMGVVVFFRRSFPDSVIEGKSGGHKLKVCDALGVKKGDGLSIRKRVQSRQATLLEEVEEEKPKPMFINGKRSFQRVKSTGKKKEAYEDNKNRAILAVQRLLPAGHDVLRSNTKKDDLCDVLLMALWVMWTRVAPRAPPKKRKSKCL